MREFNGLAPVWKRGAAWDVETSRLCTALKECGPTQENTVETTGMGRHLHRSESSSVKPLTVSSNSASLALLPAPLLGEAANKALSLSWASWSIKSADAACCWALSCSRSASSSWAAAASSLATALPTAVGGGERGGVTGGEEVQGGGRDVCTIEKGGSIGEV